MFLSLLRVASSLFLMIAVFDGNELVMHRATACALAVLLIDWRPHERD